MSNGDLNLGEDAALTAYGMYSSPELFSLDGIDSWEEFNVYDDYLLDKFGPFIGDYLADFLEFAEGLGYDPEEDFGNEVVDFSEFSSLLDDFFGNDTFLVGVDDRPGVGLLDVPDTIGGHARNEGDPIDVAIYVASTDGDVDVSGPVEILPMMQLVEVEPEPGGEPREPEFECVEIAQGTMVIDAWDTVTFDGGVPGGLFETSLANGDVGNRLEVVSRITEWLYQAVGRLPYVYGGGLFPLDYTYVLRGAGLGNGITDGRAWVLEDPTLPVPLYTEAGEGAERLTIGFEGCPVLVAAVSAELGVPGDTIEVSLANSFALNTDIQPCESCARLLNAATILRDEDGSRMAAMNQVFNTVAPADAPFTPEVAAMAPSMPQP